jgi:hypothetical protein
MSKDGDKKNVKEATKIKKKAAAVEAYRGKI